MKVGVQLRPASHAYATIGALHELNFNNEF